MLTWKSKDRRKKRDSGAGQRRKRLILSLRGLQEMKRFILYRQKEEDPAGKTDKAHCRKILLPTTFSAVCENGPGT